MSTSPGKRKEIIFQNKTGNFLLKSIYHRFFLLLFSPVVKTSEFQKLNHLYSSLFQLLYVGYKYHSTFVNVLTTLAPVVSNYKSFKKMYTKKLMLTKNKK